MKLLLVAAALPAAVAFKKDQEVLDLVNGMTQAQKLAYLGGIRGEYIGNLPEQYVSGRRIPPLNLNDGPQGFRSSTIGQTKPPALGRSTGFPSN